jgi:hypothetical protein
MSQPALWWLSFVDPDKSAPPDEQVPGGGGFLGVCIVEAEDPMDAVRRAWALGINPGGQVQIVGPGPQDAYPPEALHRLLTAEEATAL